MHWRSSKVQREGCMWTECVGQPSGMFWWNRVSSDVSGKPPDLPNSIDSPGDVALSEQYIWVRKRLHWGRYPRADIESKKQRIAHPFKEGLVLSIGYEDNDRRMAYPTWVNEGNGEQKLEEQKEQKVYSRDEADETEAVDADETQTLVNVPGASSRTTGNDTSSMADPLSFSPSDTLTFMRPFTQESRTSLRITNNGSIAVAFKAMTTAPKLYCVRPNSGVIKPGKSLEVLVILQAKDSEPPPNEKCKNKFLFQSALITNPKAQKDAKKYISELKGEGVYQHKMRAAYGPATGNLDAKGETTSRLDEVADTDEFLDLKSELISTRADLELAREQIRNIQQTGHDPSASTITNNPATNI